MEFRVANNYRLNSKKPYNRETCEIILKQLVDKEMAHFKYKAEENDSLCTRLSDEIKAAVKLSKFDRYKIVCVVTVGEKFMQDCKVSLPICNKEALCWLLELF